MDKALEMKVNGIKCDAKGCDYVNTEIPADEYDSWLNIPCPLCGANLLTKKDLIATKILMKLVKIVNSIFPPAKNEDLYKGTINMNGDGFAGMKITIEPNKDE